MRFRKADVFVVFVASFIVRILIFYPNFIPTGDVAQFSIFVREISTNGGIVPSTNSIYFPGSEYIYPPLLFLAVNYFNVLFSHFAQTGGLTVMRELFLSGALASSVTAAAVYWKMKEKTHGILLLVPAIVMVFFTPDLYAFSWGGYPFIVAEMFMILLILVLENRNEETYRWAIYSGGLYVLIALTHDLTFFFFTLSFMVIILADSLRKKFKLALMEFAAFIAGLSVGLYWWIPRIHFVLDAIGLEQSTGSGALTSIAPPATYVFPFIAFAALILVIFFTGIALTRDVRSKVLLDPLALSLLSSLVFVFFAFKDTTLAARIFYYSIVLGSILILRDLPRYLEDLKPSTKYEIGQIKQAATVFLVIIALISIPFQAASSAANVNYYSTGDFTYDQALVAWGQSNLANGTVVAPHIGNYLSAVDGVPVIIYGDFLVGSIQINQRNAAISLILNPGSTSSLQNITKYSIGYVIVKNSVLNSTINGNRILFPPQYFHVVYSDQYYTVEKYTGHQKT